MPLKVRGILLKGKKIGFIKEDNKVYSPELAELNENVIACEECIDLVGPSEDKIPLTYIVNSAIFPPRAGFYLIVFSRYIDYKVRNSSRFTYRYIVLNNIENKNILFTDFNNLVRLINKNEITITQRLDMLIAKIIHSEYVPKSWLRLIEKK